MDPKYSDIKGLHRPYNIHVSSGWQKRYYISTMHFIWSSATSNPPLTLFILTLQSVLYKM